MKTSLLVLIFLLTFIKSVFSQETLTEKQAADLPNKEEIEALSFVLTSKKMPEWIFDYKNLTSLAILTEKNLKFGKKFQQLAKLKNIKIEMPKLKFENYVNRDDMQKMTDTLRRIYHEKMLTLMKNDEAKRKVPKIKFAFLPQIDTLIISDCKQKKAPKSIKNLPNLIELQLSNNQIKTVPKELRALRKLQAVMLNNNFLTLENKNEYQSLAHIPSIYVAKNDIKSINENIILLKNVTFLNFGVNQISNIHPNIFELDSLKGIVFYKNQLTALEIPAQKWLAIEDLDLYHNKLKSVKLAGEKNFPVLKNLYLAHNELEEFDEKFANCTQLEELYLHHNKMTKLPNFVSQFKNLKILQAHNNLLIEFPNWFVEMPQIEEITLYNNYITDLPFEQLEKLKRLKKFHFSGNLIADDELRGNKMKELLNKWEKNEVNYDF